MGCSPSHALIINSNSRPHDQICLQPRIYMVSESTLRILEDVGELRIYQQEDKDPGIARVRFGTNTLDQLENPVGFQSQIKRQPSLNSEQSLAIARQDSKITVNLGTTEEEEEEEVTLTEDVVDDGRRDNSLSTLTRENSTASSTTYLVNAQVQNPSPLKTLAKETIENGETHSQCKSPHNENPTYRLESVNSSCESLRY